MGVRREGEDSKMDIPSSHRVKVPPHFPFPLAEKDEDGNSV